MRKLHWREIRNKLRNFLKKKTNPFFNQRNLKQTSLINYNYISWYVFDIEDLRNKSILKNSIGYNLDILKKWDFDMVVDLGCNKGLFPLLLESIGRTKKKYLLIDGSANSLLKASLNLVINGMVYKIKQIVIGPKNSIFEEKDHSPESGISEFDNNNPNCDIIGFKEIQSEINRWEDTEPYSNLKKDMLLKVDLEGAEFYLFNQKGAARYSKNYKYIIVEYHKPMVNLTFLREKLQYHELVYCEEHENVGYGYFERKSCFI